MTRSSRVRSKTSFSVNDGGPDIASVQGPGFDGLVALMMADDLRSYDMLPTFAELTRHVLQSKKLQLHNLNQKFWRLRAASNAQLDDQKPRYKYSEKEEEVLNEAGIVLMGYSRPRPLSYG